eukprot:m.83960 g.83960  ORF g.83960 m.83960 type:complete len:114 (+) comp12946_c0_seq7:628-969(+)
MPGSPQNATYSKQWVLVLVCFTTVTKGSWKPSMNLRTVLTSIQLLMSEPNPEDPLMADIAAEFKSDRSLFNHKARESTRRYAMPEAATSKGTQKQEKGDKQALQDRSNSNTVS